MELEVEAALLVNEGGVQCTPVVFARPLSDAPVILTGANAYLNGARVAGLDPHRAAERGPGLIAFVLDDPMDVRSFNRGDRVRLEERP